MSPLRLGAVGYLNARPLVYGLEGHSRFDVRYDVPSRCAELLHGHEIDLGLIPSIEYLRGPRAYGIVPFLAIASDGPVASVALYTRREPKDIRSIAMDTSSRTSVALTLILAAREWGLRPSVVDMRPELEAMLGAADAALIIGDNALFLDHRAADVQKIDLGELWTTSTGLPFVYAFWAGWPHAVTPTDVRTLIQARDEGLAHVDDIARQSFESDPRRQEIAGRYLRDNIKYDFFENGLREFYSRAAELQLIQPFEGELRVYHVD